MQPHIHLNEGLGIRCAILPGDPARVERIAAYLDDVCDHGSHREYRSISGTWRGVPVLAMSTGMGGPSTAIAVEELRRIGVESLLRIGSCGALQSGIAVGELLLVQAAVRDEGTSRAYVPEGYPAVSDAALLALCARSARRRGLKAHIGLVRSHDSFYIDGQEDVNRLWSGRGVLGSDMETAALLAVARLRRLRAMSILNTVVPWGGDTLGGIGAYSGGAEAGGHLRVGPIASTRMTCPEAQRERAFFAMLRSAVRYELDAKMLILSDSIGVRAVFQAAEEDQNTKNQKIN